MCHDLNDDDEENMLPDSRHHKNILHMNQCHRLIYFPPIGVTKASFQSRVPAAGMYSGHLQHVMLQIDCEYVCL